METWPVLSVLERLNLFRVIVSITVIWSIVNSLDTESRGAIEEFNTRGYGWKEKKTIQTVKLITKTGSCEFSLPFSLLTFLSVFEDVLFATVWHPEPYRTQTETPSREPFQKLTLEAPTLGRTAIGLLVLGRTKKEREKDSWCFSPKTTSSLWSNPTIEESLKKTRNTHRWKREQFEIGTLMFDGQRARTRATCYQTMFWNTFQGTFGWGDRQNTRCYFFIKTTI